MTQSTQKGFVQTIFTETDKKNSAPLFLQNICVKSAAALSDIESLIDMYLTNIIIGVIL